MIYTFIYQPEQLSGDKVLATTEYGDVMIFKGKLHIPIGKDSRVTYSFITKEWLLTMYGVVQRKKPGRLISYSNLIVKDIDFFSYIEADETYIYNYYRQLRENVCYPIVNRGKLWYDHLTLAQQTELNDWYEAWLDVTETHIIPDTPAWVNNKLNKIEPEELL